MTKEIGHIGRHRRKRERALTKRHEEDQEAFEKKLDFLPISSQPVGPMCSTLCEHFRTKSGKKVHSRTMGDGDGRCSLGNPRIIMNNKLTCMYPDKREVR